MNFHTLIAEAVLLVVC